MIVVYLWTAAYFVIVAVCHDVYRSEMYCQKASWAVGTIGIVPVLFQATKPGISFCVYFVF